MNIKGILYLGACGIALLLICAFYIPLFLFDVARGKGGDWIDKEPL